MRLHMEFKGTLKSEVPLTVLTVMTLLDVQLLFSIFGSYHLIRAALRVIVSARYNNSYNN